MEISICFFHGGQLVIRDEVIVYKGGTLEEKQCFDKDNLSRIEILWAVWALGYELVGGLYYRRTDGKFVEIVKDMDLIEYTSSLANNEPAIVYVDSPFDDLSKWNRIEEVIRGPHKSRATILEISTMSIKRTPKLELGDATTIEQENSNNTEGSSSEGSTSEESGESDSSIDSSAELNDEELEDDENSEADVDAEIQRVVKDGKTKLRAENSRKQQASLQKKSIKFGPVGIDKGLESYINSGNSYSGLLAGDEEYIGSSDVDSFASDEEYYSGGEIQQVGRRRKSRVHYDPKCAEPLWELGMVFKSVYEFRNAVKYYSVMKGVQTYYPKNEKRRVRVRCSYVDSEGEQCPWLLYASLHKDSGDFIVKNYHPVHVCVRQNKNRWCDAKFIANYFKKDIMKNPNIKVWILQEMVKDDLQLYKTKNICRKARSIVVKSMLGDYREEFRRLYDYKDCILQTNPGSTCIVDVNVEKESGKHIFKGIYLCFSAMKEGFKTGCRKCIGFDGCFLKGVHKGQLLSCVAKNGNNEIYPLAWAIVHNENTESWSWFCQLVRNDLNLGDGSSVTVVTDMQKGLEKAICDILPNAEHRECARHILANWAKKWRGVERRKCFWRCAKSTFEAQLKKNLKELSNLGDETIVPDLLRYNIDRWCRVYFNFDCVCDTVDNNFCESFNGWILGPRHKTIISMFEEIRTMLMVRHTKMIEFPNTWITDISPMAYDVLRKNTTRAMGCKIIWNGDDGYEVAEGEFTFIVSLKNKSCTCRAWNLKGIPCAHAITTMHTKGLDPIRFVDKCYHRETFLKTYSFYIQPMPNMNMIPESNNPPIEPPPFKPLPGRPKRNRRKPRDELKKCGKASKAGSHVTCGYCKEKDHNRKGCKKRKLDEIAQKNGETITLPSNPTAKGPTVRGKKATSQPSRAEVSTNTVRTGHGLFISEKSGWTSLQNGNPMQNKVISTGPHTLKSSAVVTGDLGFTANKRKWKGKDVMLQNDLLYSRAKKQSHTTRTASQLRKSQSQFAPTTEQQRMRAAANKARAESILAANNIGRSSTQEAPITKTNPSAATSASQPTHTKIWKL